MENVTETVTAPKPDAPSPDALREELVNYMFAHMGGKASRTKLEKVVDGMIALQMVYYERMATPEVVSEAPNTYAALQKMAHAIDRAVRAGAECAQAYPEGMPARAAWQSAAANMRESFNEVMACLA